MGIKVHPLIRLTFLVLIVIVNFFVLVVMVNSVSSQNQELNTIRADIRKNRILSDNYVISAERKIDDDIRANQNTENLELVNGNQSTKITDLNPQKPTQGVQNNQQPITGI